MRLAMIAVVLLAGCAHEGPSGLPIVRVELGGHTVKAEVARSPAAQARGLMYRRSMGRNDGMLFVYDEDRPLNFWIKNTYLPLSIAYIDRDMTVVRILDMKPLTTATHGSSVPVRYALEVNQGWFTEHGIAEGARANFELPKEE